MGKILHRIIRKDSDSDHAHRLPNGNVTGGMLLKPDGRHSHLYDIEGATKETSVAATGVDHNHESLLGVTGAPISLRKDAEAEIAKEKKEDEEEGDCY